MKRLTVVTRVTERSKKTLVVEYANAHEDLFEVSNNGISSKEISLNQ